MSNLYTVVWTIDIEADDPEEAAKKALEIQRDPDSEALWFEVGPEQEFREVLTDSCMIMLGLQEDDFEGEGEN